MAATRETIDETRRRLASPQWRRQEREGHVVGILLLVLPFLLSAGLNAADLHPLGLLVSAVPLVAVPAVLWRFGPRFGFDRRAAVLVAVPVLGLFVHVALAWRLGHHRTRTWKTLEPSWGRTAWTVLTVVGVISWIWVVGRAVLA
ncbi:MAG: hypothetical protein WKF86_10770 [Acidimicrobiales bacterium]